MRVLIVDNEQDRLLETAGIFKSAGHQTLGAGSGEECLRTAKAKRPHLILVDAALSDISGIDLAKEIKRDPDIADAYVVLLAAEGTPSAIQARALESGADGCLLRSLPSRELQARCEAMLRRKSIQSRLQASLQQWRNAFDAIQDAVYLVDMNHKIIECNLALAKLLRKPPSEIIGQPCYELVHGEASPIPTCLQQRVQETRQRETLVGPMLDRWLEVTVDPLLDSQDRLVGSVHILSDITERRREEQARSEGLAALQKEFEETRTALERTTDQLHAEADARQEAEEALSKAHTKLEQQAGEHLAAFSRIQHALRAEAAGRQELEQQLTQAQEAREELSEQHIAVAALAQQTEETLHQLRAQLVQEREQRSAVAAEAETYHQALATASEALQDELARRKQVEETLSQARADWEEQARTLHGHLDRTTSALQEAQSSAERLKVQRMEAIGYLAGGVAQQLDEFLSLILGDAEVGLAQSEPDHMAYSELSAVQKAARSIADWARQQTTIDRQQPVQPQLLDLNGLISRLTELLRRLIGETIDLELILEPELPWLRGDAEALEHLLTNLAQNARHNMPESGILRIETGLETVAQASSQPHAGSHQGRYLRLTVADNGAGMDEAAREHLFEPAFPDTGDEEGHGLELAEVHAIVQQHGGWIDVRSEAGQGTRFDIYLPALEPEEEAVPPAPEVEATPPAPEQSAGQEVSP